MAPWTRDLVVCASVANLLFLRQWGEIQSLYTPSAAFLRAVPPSATLFAATLMDVLVMAAACWAASIVARRSGRPWAMTVAQSAFLLLLGLGAPFRAITRPYFYDRLQWPALTLDGMWGITCVAGAVLVWTRYGRRFVTAGQRLAVVLSPLVLLLTLSTAAAHWTTVRSVRPDAFESPAAGFGAAQTARNRVLILLFDEMDADAAFSRRPPTVSMPNFDRLRSEALWAEEALEPAQCTGLSLPMLITGAKQFKRGAGERLIHFGVARLSENWGRDQNLFQEAHNARARTAVVGSFHPYCSELSGSLDYCWSMPRCNVGTTETAMGYCRVAGIAGCMAHQFRARLWRLLPPGWGRRYTDPRLMEEAVVRRGNLHEYTAYREHLLRVIVNREYGLILGHLPIPHPLGIYDRHTGRLSVDDRSNYFDNLELADRTLGEMRVALERAGLWDSTAVIVTSDHGFRHDVWQPQTTWTEEEDSFLGRTDSFRVPLLIKLPGAVKRSTFPDPVNALIVHNLSLALLNGDIQNYEELSDWMRLNRERTWVPHPAPCY